MEIHKNNESLMSQTITSQAAGYDSSCITSVCYKTGNLIIDPERCTIFRNGTPVAAGRVEFDMILCLIVNAPRICTRQLLLDIAGSYYSHILKNNTLSKHINRIRHKIGNFGGESFIRTCHSVGYQWAVPVEKLGLPQALALVDAELANEHRGNLENSKNMSSPAED
ncbi:winged helix-turn-helix domain-containing protein [Ileibacterium valens]|uniref:winged helix-turn-helix domain-containing protein n=1 Tax=Ileibacterium valens TaxID=1862668 RepID=UPI00259B2BA8|nr:winged helix-turn-helix domain-containing protein [Ileibacterium valens]